MQRVIIADDRPEWVREEDRMMICFTRCSLYKKCNSRLGADCKVKGGSEIPKLMNGRNGNGKQGKTKKAVKAGD